MQDYIIDLTTGIYRVTPDGRVFSQSKHKVPLVGKGKEFTGEFKIILKEERELSTWVNNRGYLTVCFNKQTFMVHRLVAYAYCENIENKPFVNHKDGNKLNNHYSNLEWCTQAENLKHARETGLADWKKGHTKTYKSAEKDIQALNRKLDNLNQYLDRTPGQEQTTNHKPEKDFTTL